MKQPVSPWVNAFNNPPDARLRLFCFPYAGGAAQIYKTWKDLIPNLVQVCGIRYPGRGSRFKEPLYTDLDALVEELDREIRPFLDMPFAFFGHSLGSMISFELSRRLQKDGYRPAYLFVSGRYAPQIPRTKDPVHNLPEAEFRKQIQNLNGTPPEVLAHSELMELMSPILRADFSLAETYTFKPGEQLRCPMAAFGGTEDVDVPESSVRAWGEHTDAVFTYHMIPGHHFFIYPSRDRVLHHLADYLARVMP